VIALALAKQHLRVLHDYEDDLIQLYITAALNQFFKFTGRKLYPTPEALAADLDAPEFTVVIDDQIRAGCLLLVGHLYTNRAENAPMPESVANLWQPYWVPYA